MKKMKSEDKFVIGCIVALLTISILFLSVMFNITELAKDPMQDLEIEVGEQVPIEEEEVHNIVTLPEYDFTEDEIYMLTQCVEAEAGKSNIQSQKYVTQVILNRLHSSSYPDTLEGVIYQSNGKVPQFSVAYNGSMDRVPQPETFNSVYSVIVHGTDMPDYVYFFYADYVTNNWVNSLSKWDTVEGTVFAYK